MAADRDFASAPYREVCPRCGRDAFGIACECGFALNSVERLPTRAEFEEGRTGDLSPATGAPAPELARRWIVIAVAVLILVLGIVIAVLVAVAAGAPRG